jgi:hypothetical protein
MGEDHPDDGGSKHLWNIGQYLRGYTAQYPSISISEMFQWLSDIAPCNVN